MMILGRHFSFSNCNFQSRLHKSAMLPPIPLDANEEVDKKNTGPNKTKNKNKVKK